MLIKIESKSELYYLIPEDTLRYLSSRYQQLSVFIYNKCPNRWMDDLRFYVLFNSISVISGQWDVDNERLCAMELPLPLRRSNWVR